MLERRKLFLQSILRKEGKEEAKTGKGDRG